MKLSDRGNAGHFRENFNEEYTHYSEIVYPYAFSMIQIPILNFKQPRNLAKLDMNLITIERNN